LRVISVDPVEFAVNLPVRKIFTRKIWSCGGLGVGLREQFLGLGFEGFAKE
jgi:hypothetical protein